MADRRDPAYGVPGAFADEGGIGLGDRLADCRGHAPLIRADRATDDDQNMLARFCALEDQGLGNLRHGAADGLGSERRGACRLFEPDNLGARAEFAQQSRDAIEAGLGVDTLHLQLSQRIRPYFARARNRC